MPVVGLRELPQKSQTSRPRAHRLLHLRRTEKTKYLHLTGSSSLFYDDVTDSCKRSSLSQPFSLSNYSERLNLLKNPIDARPRLHIRRDRPRVSLILFFSPVKVKIFSFLSSSQMLERNCKSVTRWVQFNHLAASALAGDSPN